MFFAQFANVTEVPLKTVFYEDFVENPVQETHNILRFYKKNFDFKPANLNWDCVTKVNTFFPIINYFYFRVKKCLKTKSERFRTPIFSQMKI